MIDAMNRQLDDIDIEAEKQGNAMRKQKDFNEHRTKGNISRITISRQFAYGENDFNRLFKD